MYCAGSFDKTIGIYDERQGSILNSLAGHNGGVTSLKFSASGWYLFTGGRKDEYVHCWDIRQQTILFSMKRTVDTHQRVLFDIDPLESKWFVTGGRNEILFYELSKLGQDPIRVDQPNEMINSAQFHPFWPILATASGERKYLIKDVPDEDSLNEEVVADVVVEPNISLWKVNMLEKQEIVEFVNEEI